MAKPLVVVIPEPEREKLRNSGVIPFGMFGTFDPESTGLDAECTDGASLYLWPYEVKYDDGRCGSLPDDGRPVDIPAFFGLGTSVDEKRKRHNERLITGLLGSVVVHVVFLDKRKGRDGYAEFKSFEEIVRWGTALKRGLDIRFRNEVQFKCQEHVLVIVARGEQVSVSQEEISAFNECVGEGRIFNSCYFLDYNLHVSGTRRLFHASEIWDVMVGRLLLAFLMSRPKDGAQGKGWWQYPGLKIWRALDCAAEIESASCRMILENALNDANLAIQNLSAGGAGHPAEEEGDAFSDVDGSPVSALKQLEPEDPDGCEWRREPPSGWSDFDAKACVSRTRDESGSRWKKGLRKTAEAFREWKKGLAGDRGKRESVTVFSDVHSSPGRLYGWAKRLFRLLSDGRDVSGGASGRDWVKLAESEKSRRDVIARLEADSKEFSAAQDRYVGFGPGLLVFLSVSLMFGWVAHRIMAAIGPLAGASDSWTLTAALVLFGCIAAGSLAAVAVVLLCHRAAGIRALEELTRESEDADRRMMLRDACARRLVENGMKTRARLRLRGTRFRTWALLKRTESILANEIQPSPSVVSVAGDGGSGSDSIGRTEEREVREAFIRETRKVFGPYAPDTGLEFSRRLRALVRDWWNGGGASDGSADGNGPSDFTELWKRVCSYDTENAGYFPAKILVSELRSFVKRFTDAVRHLASAGVVSENRKELRDGVLKWFEDVLVSDVRAYASAAVTGLHLNESGQTPAVVYFPENNEAVDFHAMEEKANLRGNFYRYRPVASTLMGRTPHLGLLFQELRVHFESDPETRNLVFKEVDDAN